MAHIGNCLLMCGVAGLFDSRGERPIDGARLAAMTDALGHRGPDGRGLHIEPGLGLGHRRLVIIDPEGGHQPLFNEDGTVAVVFNGCIYNFKELTAELSARGHRFATRSDTEVIVHAWEEWGEACVGRFRGMFALALWDRRRATLFLARDRLGIKPLYYALLPDGLVLFGSELKALLRHPGVARRLDPCAVEDYFAYGYVPDPRCIFEGAAKLAPAHTLTWRRGGPAPTPRRYWDVSFAPRRDVDPAQAEEELIERLREAVRLRLVADVPLGAFLSGGVDSSAVVAMMAGLSNRPVQTCAIAFDDPAYDESRQAEAVARLYGTEHHVGRGRVDDVDLVDELTDLYDEPFADSSAMPTYRVCRLARERVTVALSGDGGDELFAGYRRHRFHVYEEAVRSRLPLAFRRPLFGTLGRLYPKLDRAPRCLRAKATLEALGRDAAEGYFNGVAVLPDRLRRRLYGPAFEAARQGYHAIEVLRRHHDGAPAEDPLSRVQYADLMTWLPGDMLTKVDRASMAHALEVRVPLLDHEFVEWSAGLPAGLRLQGMQGKAVLKRALEPYLPRDLLYRPKMGFSVPLAAWFRGPLRGRVNRALTNGALADCGLFDLRFVRTLVEQHLSGRSDHAAALWSLLMFEAFLRRRAGA